MTSNLIETHVDSNGLTQLIQRLGRDCPPTQFVREFVQNSIEAVQRTGVPGQILVDANWDIYERTEEFKISFIDSGDGMTPDEMLQHLNNLSSSGQDPNVFENYGVGAKISALTRNHAGIIYDSWKGDVGSRIFIYFDDESQKYGVRRFDVSSDTVPYFLPVGDDEKPDLIGANGTRVTCLGMASDEDTMKPPPNTKGGRQNWLSLYLNTRYFRLPDGVTLNVRIGYELDRSDKKHNHTREIVGQEAVLNRHKVSSGVTQISDAKVHWWILNPDRQGHSRELVRGHTGCINQNEVFDIGLARSNRAGYFGILMGKEDVVMYVEPSTSKYVQNTTRTNLVEKDGSSLPWSRWEDEFRAEMPEELTDYVKRKLGEVSTESHEEKIRDRLRAISQFFKISRYRAAQSGTVKADPGSEVLSYTGDAVDSTVQEGGKRVKRGGLPGGFEELLMSGLKDDGVPAAPVTPDQFPSLTWVSVGDGSREKDECEDRAATFLQKDNMILANADFQGFKDVIEHFAQQYSEVDGSELIIKDVVQEVFEQLLIEIVTGAQSLKNRPKWKPEEFERAVSEEALTGAVMPRYFLLNHVKRQLGNHFKKVQLAESLEPASAT